MPRKPGTTETRFTFTYFDPVSASYATTESESVPVAITGENLAGAVAPSGVIPNSGKSAAVPAGGPASSASSSDNSPAGLAPLKRDVTRRVSLAPLYRRPGFLALQGVLALMVIIGFVAGRTRRIWNHPEAVARRGIDRRLNASLSEMETARLRADATSFFLAARRALQIRAGAVLRRNPESLTGADLAEGTDARLLFEMADAAEYSRVSFDPEQLNSWKIRVLTALEGPWPATPASEL